MTSPRGAPPPAPAWGPPRGPAPRSPAPGRSRAPPLPRRRRRGRGVSGGACAAARAGRFRGGGAPRAAPPSRLLRSRRCLHTRPRCCWSAPRLPSLPLGPPVPSRPRRRPLSRETCPRILRTGSAPFWDGDWLWGREKRQKGIIQSTESLVPDPAPAPQAGHLRGQKVTGVGARAGVGGWRVGVGPGSGRRWRRAVRGARGRGAGARSRERAGAGPCAAAWVGRRDGGAGPGRALGAGRGLGRAFGRSRPGRSGPAWRAGGRAGAPEGAVSCVPGAGARSAPRRPARAGVAPGPLSALGPAAPRGGLPEWQGRRWPRTCPPPPGAWGGPRGRCPALGAPPGGNARREVWVPLHNRGTPRPPPPLGSPFPLRPRLSPLQTRGSPPRWPRSSGPALPGEFPAPLQTSV